MPHRHTTPPVTRHAGAAAPRLRAARALGVLALCAMLAACSSSGDDRALRGAGVLPPAAQTPDEAPPPDVPAYTPTPTPTPVVVQPEADYEDSGHVWSYSNKAGYSYDLRIALGSPLRYQTGLKLPGYTGTAVVGSGCSVDPQTDVVIPVRWTATATTKGYETTISIRSLIMKTGVEYSGSGITPVRGDERVGVERYFSDGPDCTTLSSDNLWGYGQSSGLGSTWKSPVAEGMTAQSFAAIVVKNYYTPATPDGDQALLDSIGLRPMFGGNNAELANVYNETGSTGTYSRWMVSLAGKALEAQ